MTFQTLFDLLVAKTNGDVALEILFKMTPSSLSCLKPSFEELHSLLLTCLKSRNIDKNILSLVRNNLNQLEFTCSFLDITTAISKLSYPFSHDLIIDPDLYWDVSLFNGFGDYKKDHGDIWFLTAPTILESYLLVYPLESNRSLCFRSEVSGDYEFNYQYRLMSVYGFFELIIILFKSRIATISTFSDFSNELFSACRINNLNFVKFATSNGITDPQCVNTASSNGNLEIVQYLSSISFPGFSTSTMNRACSEGKLNVVEWLFFNRTEGCTAHGLQRAAKRNHVDVVEFLLNHVKFEDIDYLKALEELNEDCDERIKEMLLIRTL